jgi:Protein of unknown function (DUF2934)
MGREDEIRIIAYSMWEQQGCRDGHDCEHWLKAEVIWEQNQKTGAASKSELPKKTGTFGTREKNKAIRRKS